MIGEFFTILSDEAQKIWGYRWLALGTTLLVFVLGAAYVVRLPDVYDAWGQLYVNKQTPLAAAAAAAADGAQAVGDGYGSPYVVQKTLLNDPSLERVARRLDPETALLSRPALAAVTAKLRKNIHIAPDQGDGFVELHFTDADPQRARKVVQILLDQFVSSNVDRSRRELGQAERFLEDQLDASQIAVEASQAKLADLRRRYAAFRVVPQAHPSAVGSAQAPPAPVAPSPAAERVAALEAKLASLRMVYTDQYPDVVSTRRQLAEAVAERRQEAAHASAPAQAANAPALRPFAQRTVVRAIAAPPPGLSAEWADATRADEAIRLKYQQLSARRDAVRLSQAVYGSEGSGKFEVTRSPTTPLSPIGPKRDLYLGVAVLVAVGAGLGVAYLRGAMRGVLISPRELQSACQLPVAGTVSFEPAWVTGRRAQARALAAQDHRRDMLGARAPHGTQRRRGLS